MKALFASLLCLILTAAQSLAINGGPVYSSSKTYVGSYAGVLQGAFDPTNPASGNSIGVFSLSVPTTGNATGPFVMFARGRVFNGTINANADPQKASLKGVLAATYVFNIYTTETTTSSTGGTTTKTTTLPVTANVNGALNAKLSQTRGSSSSTSSSTRINGSATLFVEQGRINGATGDPIIDSVLTLSVSGFRQSTTAGTATASASPAG